jgi:transcriptional regulatory protein RtcR
MRWNGWVKGFELGERTDPDEALAARVGTERWERMDFFDRAQLAFVVRVCRESETLSAAGRKLFAATREHRKVRNDADRLRKYLARFGLDWQGCRD